MRNGITAAVALLAAGTLAATAGAEVHQFDVDAVHSHVGFKVRHLAGKTPGEFNEFSGSVWLAPEKPGQTLKIEGVIQAASIDTDNDQRDNHLRSPDFFDVEEFPEIKVVSKKVSKEGDTLTVLADVTMRGVTQEVAFTADLGGVMTNPFTSTPTTGLALSGKVNRKDFGIVWNKTLDAGGLLLGEDVFIDVQLEATVAPAETEG